MSVFTGSCKSAYLFVLRLAVRLCMEYSARYGRRHGCESRLRELARLPVPRHIPTVQPDEFPGKINSYNMTDEYKTKSHVYLATRDIPAGCKWFPLCLSDLDSLRCIDGHLSGVASYRAYYMFKANSPTFKKPFLRRKRKYNFKKLFTVP